MELKDILTIIGAVIGGMGIPKLWEALFGHLTNKKKFDSENEKEIQQLKLKISQIETSVDMLLIVIKDEFENNTSIQNAISRVEEHLHGHGKTE